METINVGNLKYDIFGIKTGAESIVRKSELGLFKDFYPLTSHSIKENKRKKLIELDKISDIKEYYNKIICLVNNISNEYLRGYIVKPSNGYPLNEVFLLPEQKIDILKKLKKILLTFEKNGIIYEDIHFDNIYYDEKTDKLELIDIDNIEIGEYKKDLETFLLKSYYWYGGKNRKNGRIYSFNLISYMYLTNNFSDYDISILNKKFKQDIKLFDSKEIYNLSKKLLTAELDSECDNIYLIDILDKKVLTK